MEQIKIREVYQKKGKFELKTDVNVDGTITLGRSMFLDIFEIYMKDKLNKEDYKIGEQINEIIKVHLPSEGKEAKDILNKGIEFNNKHYLYLVTSAGLMKKSDMELKTECECFFIEDTYKDFRSIFERVISLDKLEKLKDKKPIAINKDILSRISLSLSSGDKVYLPDMKVCVLPEMEYEFFNNYLQLPSKKEKNKNGKKIDVLDIEKITAAYESGDKNSILEKFTIEDQKEDPITHVALDGAGFISPEYMEIVKEQLNDKYKAKIDYDLSWVGIRTSMATKGLLIKFDFKKYLKEEHGLENLIVKDFWDNEVDLMKMDCIMNASQCKFAKLYDSYEEYKGLVESLGRGILGEYGIKEIFESLYIIKYNKKQAKHSTEINYQILSNIAISPNELDKIADEHEQVFKNALIETDNDISAAARRLILGDVVDEDKDELSASTKAHKILQHDDSMNELASTFNIVKNLVNKKVNTLAGGSIALEGNYKTIMKDPISYIDSLVTLKDNPENYLYKKVKNEDGIEEEKLKGIKGKISKNGLQPNTNYCPGELGNRTLCRCPLATATEVIATKFVKNKMLDKYFGDLANDILFYAFDDTMMRQSGADEDLDITISLSSPIIYNSVIEDIDENGVKWVFRNSIDGGTDEQIYNNENLYKAIVAGRGNKIGQISNISAILSGVRMQKQLPDLKLKSGELISEFDLRKRINDKYNKLHQAIEADKTLDEIDKANELKKLNENRNMEIAIVLANAEKMNEKYTDEDHKQNIINNFQANKVDMYIVLQISMLAIDSPKTGLSIDKEEKFMKEYIAKKDGVRERKPLYIYHAKYKQADKTVKYNQVEYTDSLLNNFCRRIMKTYGFKAREALSKNYKDKKLINLLRDINEEVNDEVKEKIEKINNDYHDKLDNVVIEVDGEEIEVNKEINKLREIRKTKEYRENESYAYIVEEDLKRFYDLRKPLYDRIQLETDDIIKDEIIGKYPTREVLRTLGEAKGNKKYRGNYVNIKSSFITNHFFDLLDEYMTEEFDSKYAFIEDENGKYRHLFKNYSKREEIKLKKEKLGEKEMNRKGIKNGDTVPLKTDLRSFSEEDKNKININEIRVVTFKDGYLLAENEDKIQISLGKVYDNSNKGKYYPKENREFRVKSANIYPNRKMDKAGIEFHLWY
ncbi:hypothetical protein UMC2_08121 [[Clostridium] sordellii]|uniref:hypothetical protein n=1 Tax=Paraclostridium sordellii TaxID=1505 RepID=UPI000543FDA6|nr:hypothetical protein [Paeniclostridium sordellii]CEK33562.1 hypothetical protein UMC2_08121 [[Clostridium] sordellii] [Paeniclostridium sordellii]